MVGPQCWTRLPTQGLGSWLGPDPTELSEGGPTIRRTQALPRKTLGVDGRPFPEWSL